MRAEPSPSDPPGSAGPPRIDVRRLLDVHSLRPHRSLGQNFLTDPNTIDRIVRLGLDGIAPLSPVVEVGAGLGSLTLALAASSVRVLAVEIDPALTAVLTEVVPPNVEVLRADALDLDWAATLGTSEQPWVLFGNLPYNVGATIVVRALETAPMIRRLFVMLQREVGERLAAQPRDEAFGAVSVKVSYWATATVVARVPRAVFHPRPHVDSVLLRIDRLPAPAIPPDVAVYSEVVELVRAGFAQRRKMLRRSLAGLVDAATLAAAGIPGEARAEELGIDTWGKLASCRRSTDR